MTRYAYIQNTEIPGYRAHSQYVVKTTEATVKNGYETFLILPKRPVTEWNRSDSIWDYYHVKKNIFNLMYLSGLRYYVISNIFQIFHRYLFTLDTFWFAIQAWFKAKSLGIQIIQTSDAEVVTVFNFLSFFYQPKIVYDIHHYWPRWMNMVNNTSLYVSNSVGFKEDLLKRGVDEMKIIVLPNGYDPDLYLHGNNPIQKADYGLKKSDFVVGFIGRFETFGEEKGIRTLIQSAAQVKDTIPLKILLVGEPTNLASEYSQLAKTLGISNKVIIKPSVPPTDVPGIIKLFDIGWLVYPDTPRYRNYISPMKAIEYAAARVPIIASNLPSIHDLFTEKELTFTATYDPYKLSTLLSSLYTQNELMSQKAQRAYEKIQAYSWLQRQQNIMHKVNMA